MHNKGTEGRGMPVVKYPAEQWSRVGHRGEQRRGGRNYNSRAYVLRIHTHIHVSVLTVLPI